MSGLLWFGLIVGAGIGGFWLLIRWGRAEYRLEASRHERIAALSIGDAALKVRTLLGDSALFRATAAPPENTIELEQLAPELRTLLHQYQSIELLKGDGATLQRSVVGPAEYGSGYVRIGYVAEATDAQEEVAVRPGAETVYVLYPGEAPDPVYGTYKSVYHWLLAAAEEHQG
jgi:hypothetical protein